MNPTQKHPQIDNLLTSIFGFDRRESIIQNRCVPPPIGCDQEIKEKDFQNELERKEFRISGLCPRCQREIFC